MFKCKKCENRAKGLVLISGTYNSNWDWPICRDCVNPGTIGRDRFLTFGEMKLILKRERWVKTVPLREGDE